MIGDKVDSSYCECMCICTSRWFLNGSRGNKSDINYKDDTVSLAVTSRVGCKLLTDNARGTSTVLPSWNESQPVSF